MQIVAFTACAFLAHGSHQELPSTTSPDLAGRDQTAHISAPSSYDMARIDAAGLVGANPRNALPQQEEMRLSPRCAVCWACIIARDVTRSTVAASHSCWPAGCDRPYTLHL